jgi:cell division protein FtsL
MIDILTVAVLAAWFFIINLECRLYVNERNISELQKRLSQEVVNAEDVAECLDNEGAIFEDEYDTDKRITALEAQIKDLQACMQARKTA